MIARLRFLVLAALAGLTMAAAVAAAPKTPHATPAARRAAHRPAVAAHAPNPSQRTTSTPGPRTLGDVHIEGEIAAPQVLFITARDQRRFVEFQHHRYLSTSRELGARTAFPTRIVSDAPPVTPSPEASR